MLLLQTSEFSTPFCLDAETRSKVFKIYQMTPELHGDTYYAVISNGSWFAAKLVSDPKEWFLLAEGLVEFEYPYQAVNEVERWLAG